MSPKYFGFGLQSDYKQILRDQLGLIGFTLIQFGSGEVYQILNAKEKPTGWMFSNKTDITRCCPVGRDETYTNAKFRLQHCFFAYSPAANTLTIIAGAEGIAEITFTNHN